MAMLQHDKAMELAERLGEKVFGLLVSWNGHTMTVLNCGLLAEERWMAQARADDGSDDGAFCQAEGPTAEEVMDAVAEQVEKIENPPREHDPDEDRFPDTPGGY